MHAAVCCAIAFLLLLSCPSAGERVRRRLLLDTPPNGSELEPDFLSVFVDGTLHLLTVDGATGFQSLAEKTADALGTDAETAKVITRALANQASTQRRCLQHKVVILLAIFEDLGNGALLHAVRAAATHTSDANMIIVANGFSLEREEGAMREMEQALDAAGWHELLTVELPEFEGYASALIRAMEHVPGPAVVAALPCRLALLSDGCGNDADAETFCGGGCTGGNGDVRGNDGEVGGGGGDGSSAAKDCDCDCDEKFEDVFRAYERLRNADDATGTGGGLLVLAPEILKWPSPSASASVAAAEVAATRAAGAAGNGTAAPAAATAAAMTSLHALAPMPMLAFDTETFEALGPPDDGYLFAAAFADWMQRAEQRAAAALAASVAADETAAARGAVVATMRPDWSDRFLCLVSAGGRRERDGESDAMEEALPPGEPSLSPLLLEGSVRLDTRHVLDPEEARAAVQMDAETFYLKLALSLRPASDAAAAVATAAAAAVLATYQRHRAWLGHDTTDPVFRSAAATAKATAAADAAGAASRPASQPPPPPPPPPLLFPLLRVAAVVVVYDDDVFMRAALEEIAPLVDHVLVLVNSRPWFGPPRPDSASATLATLEAMAAESVAAAAAEAAAAGYETFGAAAVEFKACEEGGAAAAALLDRGWLSVRVGTWESEAEQREAGSNIVRATGLFDRVLVLDTDEFWSPVELRRALLLAAKPGRHRRAPFVHADAATYWKSLRTVVSPPEDYRILWLIDPHRCRWEENRELLCSVESADDAGLILDPSVAVCHHLSYVRTTMQVRRKTASFSHAPEVGAGWLERKWLAWDANRTLEDLHPTKPDAYRRTVGQPLHRLPPALRRLHLAHRRGGGDGGDGCDCMDSADWAEHSRMMCLIPDGENGSGGSGNEGRIETSGDTAAAMDPKAAGSGSDGGEGCTIVLPQPSLSVSPVLASFAAVVTACNLRWMSRASEAGAGGAVLYRGRALTAAPAPVLLRFLLRAAAAAAISGSAAAPVAADASTAARAGTAAAPAAAVVVPHLLQWALILMAAALDVAAAALMALPSPLVAVVFLGREEEQSGDGESERYKRHGYLTGRSSRWSAKLELRRGDNLDARIKEVYSDWHWTGGGGGAEPQVDGCNKRNWRNRRKREVLLERLGNEGVFVPWRVMIVVADSCVTQRACGNPRTDCSDGNGGDCCGGAGAGSNDRSSNQDGGGGNANGGCMRLPMLKARLQAVLEHSPDVDLFVLNVRGAPPPTARELKMLRTWAAPLHRGAIVATGTVPEVAVVAAAGDPSVTVTEAVAVATRYVPVAATVAVCMPGCRLRGPSGLRAPHADVFGYHGWVGREAAGNAAGLVIMAPAAAAAVAAAACTNSTSDAAATAPSLGKQPTLRLLVLAAAHLRRLVRSGAAVDDAAAVTLLGGPTRVYPSAFLGECVLDDVISPGSPAGAEAARAAADTGSALAGPPTTMLAPVAAGGNCCGMARFGRAYANAAAAAAGPALLARLDGGEEEGHSNNLTVAAAVTAAGVRVTILFAAPLFAETAVGFRDALARMGVPSRVHAAYGVDDYPGESPEELTAGHHGGNGGDDSSDDDAYETNGYGSTCVENGGLERSYNIVGGGSGGGSRNGGGSGGGRSHSGHGSNHDSGADWRAAMDDGGVLHVLLGAHLFARFPRRYVVVQLEQPGSGFVAAQDYRRILRGAVAIWDFSPAQAARWRREGMATARHVPLFAPSYALRPWGCGYGGGYGDGFHGYNDGALPECQPVDILFYGLANGRRRATLQRLEAAAAAAGGLRVRHHSGLYGMARDELIRASKVVLNLHFYPAAALEVHRITYLLAMGKCVVSERAADPALDAAFAGAVTFADNRQTLVETAVALARDAGRRREGEAAARALAARLHADTASLGEALRVAAVGGEEGNGGHGTGAGRRRHYVDASKNLLYLN
ncbi:unnamed protein product [Phaeothamnion confervicola]